MTISTERNPAQLFPEAILSEPVTDTKWFVAHTKSRREKALAHFLAGRQIGYCLPMMKIRQRSALRDRHSFLPLFSGYLFFKGTLQDRYSAFSSNHVARVLEVEDQEQLREELSRVFQVLSMNVPLFPYDFLSKGQRVRIKDGPMKDLEGIIDRKQSDCKLVLSVTSISQSFAVHVDSSLVEAV
jgi:transcription antitermination factor NusG